MAAPTHVYGELQAQASSGTSYAPATIATNPTNGNRVIVVLALRIEQTGTPTALSSAVASGTNPTWSAWTSFGVGATQEFYYWYATADISGSPTGVDLSLAWDTTSRALMFWIETDSDATINISNIATTGGDTEQALDGAYVSAADSRVYGFLSTTDEATTAVPDAGTEIDEDFSEGPFGERHHGAFAHQAGTGGSLDMGWTWTAFNRARILALEVEEAAGGTPATVTPAATATTATLPAPVLVGGGVVTPATVATAGTLPAPTPAETSTVTPAAVSAALSIPAAVTAGPAVASPAATVLTVALPAVVLAGGAVTTPATLTTVLTVPQVTAVEGSDAATVTPAAITAVLSVLVATTAGTAVTEPSASSVAATMPQPATAGAAVVDLAVTDVSLTIPQADGAAPATVTPDAVTATLTIPAVSVSGAAAPDVNGVVLTLTIPQVTLDTGAVIPAYQEGGLTVTHQAGSGSVTHHGGGLTVTIQASGVTVTHHEHGLTVGSQE